MKNLIFILTKITFNVSVRQRWAAWSHGFRTDVYTIL